MLNRQNRVRVPRKALQLIAVFALLLSIGGLGPRPTLSAASAQVAGELLVKFKPGVAIVSDATGVDLGSASLNQLADQFAVSAADALFSEVAPSQAGLERIYRLTLSPTLDLLAAMERFGADPNVEYAQPNVIYQLEAPWRRPGAIAPTQAAPDDPLYEYQYSLENTGQTGGTSDADIDAPEAWALSTGAGSVLIAVIDSGVYYTHDDLDDGRVRTDIDRDFVNDDNDALDDNGHGTHVAGTIAAESNNGVGVTGVMWQAQILPLKVCNSQGSCSADAIAEAIRYAADQGARVINMSLGGACSDVIRDAVNYAHFEQGVVVVAASGNESSSVSYPAALDPVIAVGATDHTDTRAWFSNTGPQLDLTAPGVDIQSTVPRNSYDALSGTSMAAPHVAGVAGLLLAQRPELTNEQVRDILRQSADDLGDAGFDDRYGYGRVNAYRALQAATPADPAPSETPGECPACAGLATADGAADGASLLRNAYALRDRVFTGEPGRRWANLYYTHQLETAWLIASDPQLRAEALAAWRAFDPAIRALIDPQAGDVPIDAELLAQARAVLLDGLAARGSPGLRQAIREEWDRASPERFSGQGVRAAWAQLQLESELPNRVYLPLLER